MFAKISSAGSQKILIICHESFLNETVTSLQG